MNSVINLDFPIFGRMIMEYGKYVIILWAQGTTIKGFNTFLVSIIFFIKILNM